MVRFQVFDAVTGEETSEDALPRDIQGILNRYKGSSQGRGGDDLSRLARRQGQGMVGAGASGSYGRTRLPNNPLGKAVEFNNSEIPKPTLGELFLGSTQLDELFRLQDEYPRQLPPWGVGQQPSPRPGALADMAERLGGTFTPYGSSILEQQAEREAATQADSDRRQRELDGLKQYYDARTAQQLLDASNASRNVLAAPDEWEVGDENEWSVSQRAFDDLWSTPASDDSDGLQSVWTEMQEAEAFFNNFGSTPNEIISGLFANNRAAAERAEEWAKLAAKPGATAQVVKTAEELGALSAYTRNFNFNALERYRELAETEEGRIVARVQELAGDSVDIFDRDFDEDDFYREAMRAVRVADQTASADVGDMTTPEGQAQAMAHLTDFSIVSEKGGSVLISHELVQSPAEAEAALTYTFMTSPTLLFEGENLEDLREASDTSNWSVVGEDELSSPPSTGLGAIMPMPNREEQFYRILASQLAFLTQGKSTDPAPGWYSQAPTDVQVAVAKKVHQNLIATINPETGFPSPMLPTQTGGNG